MLNLNSGFNLFTYFTNFGGRNEKLLKMMHARIPMRRSGLPEELGPAVVFLASEASSYITGIVIHVDGGYMIY